MNKQEMNFLKEMEDFFQDTIEGEDGEDINAENYFLVDNSGLKRQAKCRLWNHYRSVNDLHLGKKDYIPNYNLWFGSMVHKILEELEGRDAFNGDIRATASAWYNSFLGKDAMLNEEGNFDLTKASSLEGESFRPEDANESDIDLAVGMVENYFAFLESRNIEWNTAILPNGEKAVEVPFYVKLDLYTEDGKQVVARGTIDRIVEDGFGNYYFLDYKTRSRFTRQTLSIDPQILNYLSIGEVAFPFDIKGMYFVQIMKELPKEPRVLKSKKLSTAKNQKTTYDKMEKALIDDYGSMSDVPKKYDGLLNKLRNEEHEMRNRFFAIDEIGVPESAKEIAIENIHLQIETIIDPDYTIFPTAGDHCDYCPYRDLCQLRLIGGDEDYVINNEYKKRIDRYSEEQNKQLKHYEDSARKAIAEREGE